MSVRPIIFAELSLYTPDEAIKHAMEVLQSETEFSDFVKTILGLAASSKKAEREDLAKTILETADIVFYLREEIRNLKNET